jgi:hypothetical protein
VSAATTLRAYRFVFVASIVFVSTKTLLAAHGGAGPHAHAGLIAGFEIFAALLFLWPRLEIVAGLGLLGIFAMAFAISLAQGEIPANLIFYAATVLVLWRLNRVANID